MATHHSKTGRAKSSNDKIVVPSWDSVWDSFKEKNTKTTIEAMNAEGWKTEKQVAQDTGISRKNINYLSNNGKLDVIKKKVLIDGITREINFVRPKV